MNPGKRIATTLCLCWMLSLPAEGRTQAVMQQPASSSTQGRGMSEAAQPAPRTIQERGPIHAAQPAREEASSPEAPAPPAQRPEPAAQPGPASTVVGETALFGEPLHIAPIHRPEHWFFEEVDPIQRERRLLTRMREQRARSSISMLRRQPLGRDLNAEVRQWRFSIGNTSVSNWSPYPDRALDARSIRFPLPRNMTSDKRPLEVQRLDKLKK